MSYCWDCIYVRLSVNLEPCKSCDELLRNNFKKDRSKRFDIYEEMEKT